MNINEIRNGNLQEIFSAIGFANEEGLNYKQRLSKQRQVFDFLVHIEKAVKKLSTKRTLIIVDCACGKSYLSLITNYYLTKVLNRKVEFTCIDHNEQIIKRTELAAKNLCFNNMSFICEDILKVKSKIRPDIVYSLHACNTATDMTIAKGINEQARFIMTVSCCQHYLRNNLKKHPFKTLTRFNVYKERIADMLSDTMRGLLLEMAGYQISIFDYVPCSETPKNIMLRARKGSNNEKRAKQAQFEYNKLKEMLNVEPKLNSYLDCLEKERQ